MKQFFVNTWATILRVGTALIAVFRGAGQGMTVLAVMMIADYITGVLRAALGKSDKTSGGRLSASAGFRGLLKKSLMLLAVLLSAAYTAGLCAGKAAAHLDEDDEPKIYMDHTHGGADCWIPRRSWWS